jgi:hypothetical protein
MSGRNRVFILITSFFILLIAGCESNVDKAKNGKRTKTEKITYGEVFAKAFDNGVWTELKEKDNLGNTLIQFTGKISQGLHDYSVDKLNKAGDRINFSTACHYLAAEIQKGVVAQDPDITFDISKYPIGKTGLVFNDRMEDYIGSEDNKGKVAALVDFYKKKYFEDGSDVTIKLSVIYNGKIIKIYDAQNKNWEYDMIFNGKTGPDNVLKAIFDYALNVK